MTLKKEPDSAAPTLPEGAYTQFQGQMSYGNYMGLDKLLSCQNRLSGSHDEMLFIIQHQSTELWLKLILHEIDAAIAHLRGGEIRPVLKMLARVCRVQTQITQLWDVLSTMTPADYMTFREKLGRSSGFQSYQYRLLEFKLGNKNAAMIEPHAHQPEVSAQLEAALHAPSLYDEVVGVLARHGLQIDPRRLAPDFSQPTASDPSVQAAWLAVYRDTATYWDLYELAEELVDVEDGFGQWRFRHVTTVQRIIGFKRGTGGTGGVSYLRKVLEVRLFPELWDLRTDL